MRVGSGWAWVPGKEFGLDPSPPQGFKPVATQIIYGLKKKRCTDYIKEGTMLEFH